MRRPIFSELELVVVIAPWGACNASVHPSAELTAPTASTTVILFGLLRVPFPSCLSTQLAQSIALSFTIHGLPVQEFLAAFRSRDFLSLLKRRLVGFGTGMGGCFLGRIELRGGHTLGQFLFCEFRL
jgi:hypothetical protein